MLVVGKATKIQDLLMSEDKEYVGTLTLGATTNTQDAKGEILVEKPFDHVTEGMVRATFREVHWQL